jgi:hypothetical protein
MLTSEQREVAPSLKQKLNPISSMSAWKTPQPQRRKTAKHVKSARQEAGKVHMLIRDVIAMIGREEIEMRRDRRKIPSMGMVVRSGLPSLGMRRARMICVDSRARG